MKIHPKVSILFSIFQIFLYIFVALIETLNTWNTMNRIRSKAARGMFAAFFYSQMIVGGIFFCHSSLLLMAYINASLMLDTPSFLKSRFL